MQTGSLHRLLIFGLLPLLGIAGCAPLPAQTDQMRVQQRTIDKLREENRQFQDAYYKIKEQLDAQNEQSQKQAEQMTRDLQEARNERTLNEKALDKKLSTSGEEYTKFKKETLDQIVLLQAQNAKLQQDIQGAITERNAAQEKLKQAEAQIQAEQARSNGLAQQAAKVEADMKTLSGQVAELKHAVQVRDEALTGEKSARTAAEQERDAAKQQLADQGKSLQAAQSELTQTKKKADAASQAEQAASQIQRELEQARKDKEALTREVAGLKSDQAKAAAKPAAPASAADDPEMQRVAATMEQTLKSASSARGVAVRLDRRGVRVIVPGSLLFDNNKATLSRRAGDVLGPIAQGLGQTGGRPVTVEGHTDNQAPEEPYADNWMLGFARADRVREFLMRDGGVDASRLTALSRAQFEPIASNDSADGRRQNRRVEIVIGAR